MSKQPQAKAPVSTKAQEKAQARKNLLNKDLVKNNESFTTDQILDLFDAFQSFVDPHSKLMNMDSLISCASTLGLDQKNPTIIKILNSIKEKEVAGEIQLDFDTFLLELTETLGNVRTTEGRASLFQLIDFENKDSITFDNLKALAKEVGHVITDDELREIVDVITKNETISKEEFDKYLARKVADK